MADVFTCSLCNEFTATSMRSVLRHIGLIHSHEPNFSLTCGIHGCPRTYRNYDSFRKHLARHHADALADPSDPRSSADQHENLTEEGPDEEFPEFPENYEQLSEQMNVSQEFCVVSSEQKRRHLALFVLKTREVLNLSESATKQIITDVTDLLEQTLIDVHMQMEQVLSANHIQSETLISFKEIFQEHSNPFVDLQSKYMQDQYLCEHLGLVVCCYYILCMLIIIPTCIISI